MRVVEPVETTPDVSEHPEAGPPPGGGGAPPRGGRPPPLAGEPGEPGSQRFFSCAVSAQISVMSKAMMTIDQSG